MLSPRSQAGYPGRLRVEHRRTHADQGRRCEKERECRHPAVVTTANNYVSTKTFWVKPDGTIASWNFSD